MSLVCPVGREQFNWKGRLKPNVYRCVAKYNGCGIKCTSDKREFDFATWLSLEATTTCMFGDASCLTIDLGPVPEMWEKDRVLWEKLAW